MTSNNDHARQSAIGALKNIMELQDAWEFATGELQGRDISIEAKRILRERGFKGDNFDDMEDEIRECISEVPLSVQVRSGWSDPGSGELPAEEFEILLTTGGPGVRIMGELDESLEPCRAWIEYQDWGTPWQELVTGDNTAPLWFANQFWFGA